MKSTEKSTGGRAARTEKKFKSAARGTKKHIARKTAGISSIFGGFCHIIDAIEQSAKKVAAGLCEIKY
ncbi:hypothetical protein RWV98_06255 [Agathobaculum sp. NTUH-O15-33]|uniref:hypothetical protein n=1 Tax=Agathobaculum sp. NTUH-O15-33 TaxID=3079302 RepID=UPI00295877BD|nr:hypothetical protein [Agathobaculum sp. NTUH-O15-33]WNX85867.1 hypothetical protein RWV98_06255 [Agathobaculum sp. NTUH-O15-33]